MGRATEAMAEIKRAQELDPLRITLRSEEGTILYFSHRYDEAIKNFQNVLKMEPEDAFAFTYLGYTYAAKGMYREAIEAYQKVNSIAGETTSVQCYLGYALAKSGKRSEAQAILDNLKKTKEYVSPVELATLYVGLGDNEAALASLERAYQAHDPQFRTIKVDSHYDGLHGEPRFQELLRKVGLPL
jgi:serine/threonine-protein kinase